MLKNATYNLMETASVLSKGLHRYDTFQRDAQGCQGCTEIWNHMKGVDEEQLQRIVQHLRQHMQDEPSARGVVAA